MIKKMKTIEFFRSLLKKNLMIAIVVLVGKGRAFLVRGGGRYLMPILVTLANILLFQNCSRGDILISKMELARMKAPSEVGGGSGQSERECLPTDLAINLDCGLGMHGPWQKICENNKWVTSGSCERDSCEHPVSHDRINVGDSFSLQDCGDGRTGENRYRCTAHNVVEVVLSESTCKLVDQPQFACEAGEAGPSVSCEQLAGFGIDYVGEVPSVCKGDRTGFEPVLSSAAASCELLQCRDYEAQGNVVLKDLGSQREISCPEGQDGSYVETCRRSEDRLSAQFVRAVGEDAPQCQTITCDAPEGVLSFGQLVHRSCAANESGSGWDYQCRDDSTNDGKGVLEPVAGGSCIPNVCEPRDEVFGACSSDDRYTGQLVVGDIRHIVSCDSVTNKVTSDILSYGSCLVKECDPSLKPSENCDPSYEGQKQFKCVLDENGDPQWQIDEVTTTCVRKNNQNIKVEL